jgi:hypothetical protein
MAMQIRQLEAKKNKKRGPFGPRLRLSIPWEGDFAQTRFKR